jgi:hypothetical protein
VKTPVIGLIASLSVLACSAPALPDASAGTDVVAEAGPPDARDPAPDALTVADAVAASDALADAPADVPAGDRTIPPVMPGTFRDITPPGLDPAVNPCTDIQFDPGRPTTLYAMFGAAGIWRSTDAGAHWVQIGNLPTPTSLGRLLVDPHDAMHLYATGSVNGSSLGFWVSHDGGATFAIPAAFTAGVGTTWNQDVYNMAVDPADFGHVLLTFHSLWPGNPDGAGVLETLDGGATFVPHAPLPGMSHGQGVAFLRDLAHGVGDARTWLLGNGYGDGIYRTTSAGAAWTQVSPAQEDHGGFDAHYSSQGFLYIGARDGVYRSRDNGVTFQNVSSGALATWTYTVIGDGHYLYSSPGFVGQPSSQPFFVSPEGGADEGEHWTPYNAQVIPEGPWRMRFDAANGIIYNAAWGGGAWALTTRP